MNKYILVVVVIVHVYVVYLYTDVFSIKHMFIFCIGHVVNDFVCVCATFWVPIMIACCVFVFRFVASCSGCVFFVIFCMWSVSLFCIWVRRAIRAAYFLFPRNQTNHNVCGIKFHLRLKFDF